DDNGGRVRGDSVELVPSVHEHDLDAPRASEYENRASAVGIHGVRPKVLCVCHRAVVVEREGVREIALPVKVPATQGHKRCSGGDESVTVQEAIRAVKLAFEHSPACALGTAPTNMLA